MSTSCCCGNGQADDRLSRILDTIDRYKDMRGALIPVLHEIQDTYGYLPEDVLQVVASELKISMSEIYGVATFYSFFSLEPKGENVIRVCLGTACYIKGAQGLQDRFALELGIKVQGTTDDGCFTLEATRCLGACGLAPVVTINGNVYGRLTPNDIPKLLREYRKPKHKEEVQS